MEDENSNQIQCSECGERPELRETPYAETDYIVTCDCELLSIDVSDCVNGHSLIHPLSGHWSTIDHNYKDY